MPGFYHSWGPAGHRAGSGPGPATRCRFLTPARGGIPRAAIQAIARVADEPRMLLCKSCNTRFEDGRTACPSCGRRIFVSLKETSKSGDSGPVSLAGAMSTAEGDISANEL